MNQVVVVLLCVVLFGVSLTHVAGYGKGRSQRCLCRGRILKSVRPKLIRTVEMLQPSPSCSKTEIILTVLAKGRGKGKGNLIKVCLDPNEKQGRRFLKAKGTMRRNKKAKEWRKKKEE